MGKARATPTRHRPDANAAPTTPPKDPGPGVVGGLGPGCQARASGASAHEYRQSQMVVCPEFFRCDQEAMGELALYVDARRDAISLWRSKWQLLKAGEEKFFKSSKEFRAIDRLCCWDPTERIRSLADGSACRFADKHGDNVFRKTVDGTELYAVT